jgi:hypothetical protein
MLNLDADEQEINLADDDILQVVPVELQSPVIRSFERNMKGEQNSNGEWKTYLDLLYSNSMCKQSSIPTSILIELLMSGGIRKE